MMASKGRWAAPELPDDPLAVFAKTLVAGAKDVLVGISPARMAKLLHRAMDGPSPEAERSRAMLELHLARVRAADVMQRPVESAQAQRMISTTQAAEILGCSRPHVAMLIDGGVLKGATRSAGGHRQIPKAEVLRFKGERASTPRNSYRAVGLDAGIYDVPEEAWVQVAKRGGR